MLKPLPKVYGTPHNESSWALKFTWAKTDVMSQILFVS